MAAGFGLNQILEWTGGRLVNGDVLGSSAKAIRVEHLAPLGRAKALDCAFFFSRAFQQELLSTEAGVLITADAFVPAIHAEADRLPFYKRTAIIACPDAYYAMAVLSEHFAKGVSTVAHLEEEATSTVVHPTAVVDPTAKIGSGVRIGPHCVVDAGATIGRGTILYPRAHVGPSVEIGEDCVFFTGVTLYEWTKIGNRVRIHAGSTIGADGFGYAPVLEKGVPVGHRKIYHLGRVVIGSDVEIGANSMIDRATFGETVIGDQVKIDNHVHVGHNSVVGEGTILCGGVLLAGGTRIGKFVYVGGFTGIGNKAVIGDYAKVGGASMVDKDVPAGGTAVGIPQRTHREHFKVHALLNRLLLERDRRGRDAPKGK